MRAAVVAVATAALTVAGLWTGTGYREPALKARPIAWADTTAQLVYATAYPPRSLSETWIDIWGGIGQALR